MGVGSTLKVGVRSGRWDHKVGVGSKVGLDHKLGLRGEAIRWGGWLGGQRRGTIT